MYLPSSSTAGTVVSSSSALKYLYPQAASLIALAPRPGVITRTALMGTASLLDTFFLVPGFLSQQDAVKVNNGEYPATAAMTTGYVFRVENQAAAAFLQRVGITGHLVTLEVEKAGRLFTTDPLASFCYLTGAALTIAVVAVLLIMHDIPAVLFLATLMAARLLNVIALKRRTSTAGWKGAPEPGVRGDLLILVSEDRWIRLRGAVDDLKATISGHWLREMRTFEHVLTAAATYLAYGSMAFAWHASARGSALTTGLLLASSALLGLCNAATTRLRMFGRTMTVVGDKAYGRRLDMAADILEQTRELRYPDSGWAVKLGLVNELPGAQPHVEILTL